MFAYQIIDHDRRIYILVILDVSPLGQEGVCGATEQACGFFSIKQASITT